ncbi:hypothetical protein MLP_46940 [Microlunatus phosphovorus NM-1]|uniref:Uncharacterized protein n=1 Tax=Microlunatus phosphovorus (strain ATCC 700054 / DSM 10555 / JCM 9379 / NBRC 101784 / NCIMB 13414 / VKM Ac-1990 / NM-1) TaxID=1032480 RepID=F5XEG0_MICPN|nr:hypothetical protein MLP_46940 [Microlunatus phosphovorus NM-1]
MAGSAEKTAVIIQSFIICTRSAFDLVGVGTVSDRSAGCRGVVGPFPRPLWMN